MAQDWGKVWRPYQSVLRIAISMLAAHQGVLSAGYLQHILECDGLGFLSMTRAETMHSLACRGCLAHGSAPVVVCYYLSDILVGLIVHLPMKCVVLGSHDYDYDYIMAPQRGRPYGANLGSMGRNTGTWSIRSECLSNITSWSRRKGIENTTLPSIPE